MGGGSDAETEATGWGGGRCRRQLSGEGDSGGNGPGALAFKLFVVL